MRKYLSYIIVMVVTCVLSFILAFVLFHRDVDKNQIVVVNDESYFSDFSIKGDTVSFDTTLTLSNTSDESKVVNIVGYSSKDQQSGLIVNEELTAYDESGNLFEVVLDSHEKKTFRVVFVGRHGSNTIKQDRLLPEIVVLERTLIK